MPEEISRIFSDYKMNLVQVTSYAMEGIFLVKKKVRQFFAARMLIPSMYLKLKKWKNSNEKSVVI